MTVQTGDARGGRLSGWPDLVYVIREYDKVYRHGSAGGSRPIRTHLRRVRELVSDLLEADPPVQQRTPAQLPVVSYLGRALDQGLVSGMPGFSRALQRVVPLMHWEHGYERVPRGLGSKYAYCELVGPSGPVLFDELILGLVLFAPRTIYPQHAHPDIEESYVAISGAWSENDAAVYSPGSLILNVPDHEHRITTGLYEPCLLAYAWLGPTDRLRSPGMSFVRRR